MYLLGFDIGSSSIKAALVDAGTGAVAASVQVPNAEMEIFSSQPGWAEQDPEIWWENCCLAIQKLKQTTGVQASDIGAIGISYQMHGLVTIDGQGQILRPAINLVRQPRRGHRRAGFPGLGRGTMPHPFAQCARQFHRIQAKWVKENEPRIYERIRNILLPGDYIAYRMTGEIRTTVSGLSEGILWDFATNSPAQALLDHYGIDKSLIPPLTPTFGIQGQLTASAAKALGLRNGLPVTYRAGDQPNNALSLNVLNPGEVAATGGTSGVVYGVVDKLIYDDQNRVNSFAHVNHRPEAPRIGVLLCINGAGIQYSWMRRQMAEEGISFPDMERRAATVPIGSDGLRIIPFGNGAERMLGNRDPGARVLNLHFNRHQRPHFYRAALEGIAFSFVYGMNVLRELGLDLSIVRVGNDNLFQSAIFAGTISNLTGCRIEMLRTTGAVGAAIASGVGIGIWTNVRKGLGSLEQVGVYEPDGQIGPYESAYADWLKELNVSLRS